MSFGKWMDKEVVVHIHKGILLSYKKECIWISSNEVGEPKAYYIEWSKSEREMQILYVNAYVWNLERWYLWFISFIGFCSYQFSSVAQSCPTLCDPMNHSTPSLPVYHQLPEFTQIHVHWVSDAIQPSHPLSSPSLPAPNPSQHQSLCQWVNSSHEVAKVLEFQL